MKKCYLCKEEKSYTEFYKHRGRHDGHSASCKSCESLHKRKAWAAGGNYKLARQKAHLVRTYGKEVLNFTKPECCPICLRTEDETRDTLKRAFVVDHCHETNVIRGLICTQCNKGLGYFRDNVEDLQRAINYLQSSKEKI